MGRTSSINASATACPPASTNWSGNHRSSWAWTNSDIAAEIKAHSIIADRSDPPRDGGGDGLVPYESAHLDCAVSELLVSSGHLCQDNPAVIREVRRILLEHGIR